MFFWEDFSRGSNGVVYFLSIAGFVSTSSRVSQLLLVIACSVTATISPSKFPIGVRPTMLRVVYIPIYIRRVVRFHFRGQVVFFMCRFFGFFYRVVRFVSERARAVWDL